MAGASLFALLDDIATVLDDVAFLTKVAAKKTAGVLGDDLALNAQQVSGVSANREIPVVWSVAKGSFKNKLILVPTALALSALLPQLILPLLIIGGLFLCFEGTEKLWHKLAHQAAEQAHKEELKTVLLDGSADMAEFEQGKIKGAIRTDFILSAEIIVISLGTTASAPFSTQALVVSVIALAMTVGVYGLVAGIVKLDDLGLYLAKKEGLEPHSNSLKQTVGLAILAFCPWLMKGLSFFGTLAMFLVGGGIIAHGVPVIHHIVEAAEVWLFHPTVGALIANLIIGLFAGGACLLAVNGVKAMQQTKNET